jgi:hypothetical protein
LKTIKATFILILLIVSVVIIPAYGQKKEITYSQHPRDIIIQMQTNREAGFDIMRLTAVPEFTLYGDGRVIFADTDEDGNVQLLETRLSPEEVMEMLRYMDRQGFQRLNENFLNLTLADLDTTTITVRTRENTKTVKVYGFKLAAYQHLLPRGLVNIHGVLSNFKREEAVPYVPQRISLYVDTFDGDVPRNTKVTNWSVRGVDLRQIIDSEEIALKRFRHTVLTGNTMLETVDFLKGKTLYSNRSAFLGNLFKQGRVLYSVGYRPHLPYE